MLLGGSICWLSFVGGVGAVRPLGWVRQDAQDSPHTASTLCRQLHSVKVPGAAEPLQPALFPTFDAWIDLARGLSFEDPAKQQAYEQVGVHLVFNTSGLAACTPVLHRCRVFIEDVDTLSTLICHYNPPTPRS
jgi:hypothetical protein